MIDARAVDDRTFDQLRSWAAVHGLHRPVRFTVECEDGTSASVPIPFLAVPVHTVAVPSRNGDDKPFCAVEAAILEALDGADAATGEALAAAAGYPFNGRFRNYLAGLVRRGEIESLHPGYALAEKNPDS